MSTLSIQLAFSGEKRCIADRHVGRYSITRTKRGAYTCSLAGEGGREGDEREGGTGRADGQGGDGREEGCAKPNFCPARSRFVHQDHMVQSCLFLPLLLKRGLHSQICVELLETLAGWLATTSLFRYPVPTAGGTLSAVSALTTPGQVIGTTAWPPQSKRTICERSTMTTNLTLRAIIDAHLALAAPRLHVPSLTRIRPWQHHRDCIHSGGAPPVRRSCRTARLCVRAAVVAWHDGDECINAPPTPTPP